MVRLMKGSRLQDAYPARPDSQHSDIDSAFPLQEYIAYLVHDDPHDVERIVSLPGSRSEKDGEPSAGLGLGIEERDGGGVDESCWIYEQLRRLAQDLTHPLMTSLQAECNRSTCPEMKAGEWLYLCVAHGNGPSATMEPCCAIDYITHTLDSATALLNSPRAFPSRLEIPPPSTKQFSSLARRLSRIFAHAYYHHREAFEQSEAESSLYARFLLLSSRFNLVPPEFLVHPGSAQPPADPIPLQESVLGPPAEISSPAPPSSPPPPVNDPDFNRRQITSRSRTDTMYLTDEADFDLSEFADAAGDAMASVRAEREAREQPEEVGEGDGEDEGYITVPVEGHREHVDSDKHMEDIEIEIEDTGMPLEDHEGSHEPNSSPAEHHEAQGHSGTLPGDKHVIAKVDRELEDAVEEEKEDTQPEETGDEDEHEELGKLSPGEVRSIPAQLGLDSEAHGKENNGPAGWGEPASPPMKHKNDLAEDDNDEDDDEDED